MEVIMQVKVQIQVSIILIEIQRIYDKLRSMKVSHQILYSKRLLLPLLLDSFFHYPFNNAGFKLILSLHKSRSIVVSNLIREENSMVVGSRIERLLFLLHIMLEVFYRYSKFLKNLFLHLLTLFFGRQGSILVVLLSEASRYYFSFWSGRGRVFAADVSHLLPIIIN